MLQLRELQKTFFEGTPNEVRALRGVSLQIEEGSFVIVIGTNGSGKSTLLNAVAGSFMVDRGAISIAGRDVTRWPEHRRAAMIGRVFQNPFSGTAPTMTLAEHLALPAPRGRAPPACARRRSRPPLRRVRARRAPRLCRGRAAARCLRVTPVRRLPCAAVIDSCRLPPRPDARIPCWSPPGNFRRMMTLRFQ